MQIRNHVEDFLMSILNLSQMRPFAQVDEDPATRCRLVLELVDPVKIYLLEPISQSNEQIPKTVPPKMVTVISDLLR